MKYVSIEKTHEFKNSNRCVAVEYSHGDKDINIAVIKLSGRYPETGYAINEKSKEIGYVIKGEGKIVVEDKVVNLKEGDAILIEPGEKFYWDGIMMLLMPCTPAWTPEQYKLIK